MSATGGTAAWIFRTCWSCPTTCSARFQAARFRPRPVSRWAFLDTETTGLAGGTGTYAFLIGVGRVTPEGFRVRQFFMRDYAEEASLLCALSAHLAQFDVLVTYNGKAYDQPLLETRFEWHVRARLSVPMAHLDLLLGARRLWKLRLESCRLVDLERQILGVEREGDLPGEMIPYVYFEYLRTERRFPAGADLPSQRGRYSDHGVLGGDRTNRASRSAYGRHRSRGGPGWPGALVPER